MMIKMMEKGVYKDSLWNSLGVILNLFFESFSIVHNFS